MQKVNIPPIKCQGIKSKLVQRIASLLPETQTTTYIEPFMGSGVVGFNIAPSRAVFADSNPHIISFYRSIQAKDMTPADVRDFLTSEGRKLLQSDGSYYYEVRERFNEDHSPYDLLFLNRSCFNGMMRFNKKGKYNVPFGKKPARFSKALITKIVNQVTWVYDLISRMGSNWEFRDADFSETLSGVDENCFVYCDPPYIGRHVDYYDSWDEADELMLHSLLKKAETRFILSTWKANKYRSNPYLDTVWGKFDHVTSEHFYHVGAKESNRNSMTEAMVFNYCLPESAQSFVATRGEPITNQNVLEFGS